ncbi:uncharacterized protein TRAVEDRAFT_52735 [Trametes versicolor FP-101664 SS1]|uniref:uncharacterized protein n=1 Tax=Trametes versicolor (strain FP-101664) TaxID=717944 RepID=UPI0004622378|nr:uncharacterized protein TRAVEDRAFT_52735 [Trametes versicolor FP-101664 SS1]EIW53617.1 hypothetical protein TRAVEDRAFT_52735 [Trametes versicolor FP-101664 SS1]
MEMTHRHGVPIAGGMESPHANYRTRIGKDLEPYRPRSSYAYSSRASTAGAARPRKFSDLVHVKIDDDAPAQVKGIYDT